MNVMNEDMMHHRTWAGLIDVITWLLVVIAAIVMGAILVERGTGLLAAAFLGAGGAMALLYFVVLPVYLFWAWLAWGAPFVEGDTVRVARGPHAGQRATVTGIGQGGDVNLRIETSGVTLSQVPWSLLRRESPRSPARS